MRAREIVTVCIRGLAALIGLCALVLVAAQALYDFPYGIQAYVNQPPFWKYEHRWEVLLVIVAVVLWLCQNILARLIVPRVGPTCPECSYSLRNLKSTRCPECGADVSRKGAG
jgi:hypothetical protein